MTQATEPGRKDAPATQTPGFDNHLGFVNREFWGTASIVVIWIAVLFDGVYGNDFKSFDVSGSTTVIPSVVFVALFAAIATASIAKRLFVQNRQ